MKFGKTGISELQKAYTESVQNMADISINAYKAIVDGVIQNNETVGSFISDISTDKIFIPGIKFKNEHCCPPNDVCPPHCISSVTRQAMAGESIIVPILIKNTCSSPKQYRVGVRELIDLNNKPAPNQPQLNKNIVSLAPNGSERVLMKIDLNNFQSGQYSTEIVLREKDINQNICFNLIIKDHKMVLAEPRDEKIYKRKWQSWKSHFYCDLP